jgi:AraC-like DNA-binding protein
MSTSGYRERPAPPDLRHDVACTWVGHIGTMGPPYVDRVLPDGCIDVIWDGSRCFVAGPDTTAAAISVPPGTTFIGVRFRPGHAAPALAVPPATIRDARPDLEVVWDGPTAAQLAERLTAAPSVAAAVAVLERAVRDRIRQAATAADPLTDAVVRALAAGDRRGPGVVSRLARDLGVTERTLHRRCTAAVGYGPKVLERVLRLRRALAVAAAPTRSVTLGAVAAASGYADQAHFTREVHRLAGVTPSDLFKTPG